MPVGARDYPGYRNSAARLEGEHFAGRINGAARSPPSEGLTVYLLTRGPFCVCRLPESPLLLTLPFMVLGCTVGRDEEHGYAHAISTCIEERRLQTEPIVLAAGAQPCLLASLLTAHLWVRLHIREIWRSLGCRTELITLRHGGKLPNLHVDVRPSFEKESGSMGAAFAASIVSRLTGRRVSRHAALTGQVLMRGDLRGVGGVRAKARAAAEVGVQVMHAAEGSWDTDMQGTGVSGLRYHRHMINMLREVLEPETARDMPAGERLRVVPSTHVQGAWLVTDGAAWVVAGHDYGNVGEVGYLGWAESVDYYNDERGLPDMLNPVTVVRKVVTFISRGPSSTEAWPWVVYCACGGVRGVRGRGTGRCKP